eukprot:3305277-Alexandrium_andersonii.AAC.1
MELAAGGVAVHCDLRAPDHQDPQEGQHLSPHRARAQPWALSRGDGGRRTGSCAEGERTLGQPE